ncbi:Lanthionine synthetase C-like protein [Methylocystis sp. SC2]|nr:Lanthionine synthetase C-like protein [Methylocystis sp. SC2]
MQFRPGNRMDSFYERLIVRASTIEELLSDDFETLPGQKGDAEFAAKRLAAWCRSCASGDWSLFNQRLERDKIPMAKALGRFATVRRVESAPPPAWLKDAAWIATALQGASTVSLSFSTSEAAPFEHLFLPLATAAAARLWGSLEPTSRANFAASASACLQRQLLKELCDLCAPVLYELFVKVRQSQSSSKDKSAAQPSDETSCYHHFICEMRSGGLRRLFDEKPVLLRLIAVVTRQWLESSREFVLRLNADLSAIHREILHARPERVVKKIDAGLSDRHHGGRSVLIVEFEDGSRVVYKPKDLRLDVRWRALVERLNNAGAPIELRTPIAISREGYGWTAHIRHVGCADSEGCRRFYRRAGAWLALFYSFVGADMHQENIIAAGEHPVPIDLETIIQAADEGQSRRRIDASAFEAAKTIIANSVISVGLLPAYGKSADNDVFVVGGMAAEWTSGTKRVWIDINTDAMRPKMMKETGSSTPNLPHVDGCYAKLSDHVDDFIAGFEAYANFILSQSREYGAEVLCDAFAGLQTRKVLRPTQFYTMLLYRLRNHQVMNDGILWSAEADFLARFADWESDEDQRWPLQRTERAALLELNVPHFVMRSDASEISDGAGVAIRIDTDCGLARARDRIGRLSEQDIAWQVQVIRQSLSMLSEPVKAALKDSPGEPPPNDKTSTKLSPHAFLEEADAIAAELSDHAIRRERDAAWIGLSWLANSEVSQLVVLGPDLYNGACGIALFLAAHAVVGECQASADLALAGISRLRSDLRNRNAARLARSLGLGGATGLGSIIYALSVISKLLGRDDLLDDAHRAAALLSDDLIEADRQLDVINGSSGAILGLLRLYRDADSADALKRAVKCGEHLLAQPRIGVEGRRSWAVLGAGLEALTGMSHGAAGFAYALASLSAATGCGEFATAAMECIAYEDSKYDPERANWPDFRYASPQWRSQWCHGAVGIGLARIAMTRTASPVLERRAVDVSGAVAGAERGWPSEVDTLCCGAMGNVEFLREAGAALGRQDLSTLASDRLSAVLANAASVGDYRWSHGERPFNLGLFRGLSGVGYTCLRQIAENLPNVLIWE